MGRIGRSLRCYHWLFVWAIINLLFVFGTLRRGFIPGGAWWAEPLATIVFGYLFIVDMSAAILWDEKCVWWSHLDYFWVRPIKHSVVISDLKEIVAVNNPANLTPGKPFDRFELVSSSDSVVILLGFYRREGVEELLRFLNAKRPEVLKDPLVLGFMEGGFTKWWRYR